MLERLRLERSLPITKHTELRYSVTRIVHARPKRRAEQAADKEGTPRYEKTEEQAGSYDPDLAPVTCEAALVLALA